jgi:hypothetical protein
VAKKSKTQPKPPPECLYQAREDDLDKIDSMISILGFAVGEILRARLIRNPPEEDTPHEDDFNDQVQLALDDAERQMDLPWGQDEF